MKTLTAIVLFTAAATAAADCVPGFSPPCPNEVATASQQYQTVLTCVYRSRTIDLTIRAAKPISLPDDPALPCAAVYDALDMGVIE